MQVKADELLQKPYWIIDILPERVPENSPGMISTGTTTAMKQFSGSTGMLQLTASCLK
ncbi:MAG: hypothetical protein IKO76_09015 [Butyrivibrio sp.]|nr:hypothetical protein [Butyrivibrio sp.]